jgi:DNA-binding winged helix-turn-helix (wHTH) protein
VRYRFGPFLLSPARRVLRRHDQAVRLIPRYFDLLLLLVEERHRAVSRQEIFDRVWADVVVSDGALTQAIRTIRRTLGDGTHEPQFIRTVSRHGYQFVAADVTSESDDGPLPAAPGTGVRMNAGETAPITAPAGERERLLTVLFREGAHADATEDERYDAAVSLHELGTSEALERLADRPGHEEARAILRDARWDAPGAGPVPLISAHGRLLAILDVVRLRMRHAARLASARWLAASLGGAVSGAVAGLIGGVALGLVPGARIDPGVMLALAIIGTGAGALGAAGIGGGLATAETLARSARAVALTSAGAVGGALSGAVAHSAARAVLADVFGRDVPNLGGALEGLILGGVLGCGYAVATRRLAQGGMAAPRGRARWRVAMITGLAAALTGAALGAAGWSMVATSLDSVASVFAGSSVGLDLFARLLGEDSLRPVTRTIVSGFEAFMLGAGIAYGLTHRPRS